MEYNLAKEIANNCLQIKLSEKPIKKTVFSYKNVKSTEKKNQFLILIKPECLFGDKESIEKVLELILNILHQNGIEVNSTVVMNSNYIIQNSIVENQYYVLNKLCTYGRTKLSEEVEQNIYFENKGINIIGAFKFLQLFPEFNEESLEQIAHTVGSEKLGNGMYLLKIKHKGVLYGVLNAFHPFQKKHFEKKGNCIVAFECISSIDYDLLDEKVIGFFNPENARDGSIRKELFDLQDFLNIRISTIFNGVHVSPSPLEGLKSIINYFTDESGVLAKIEHTNLGSELIKNGFEKTQIQNLFDNPSIEIIDEDNQKQIISLFGYLEGKNTKNIIDDLCLLKGLV